jgi:hypothetical protein
MIWHIFKKDWKLLWRYAAGFGALYFVLDALRLTQGRFYQARLAALAASSGFLPGRDIFLASTLPTLALLGSALLVAIIVQQDAIPGLRQDWLVRPIRRRDLLLSKLVSVLIMVQLPMFAADLAEGLASGFSLAQSASAAFGRSAYCFFSINLPMFAFASLTRNLMEAIVGAAAVAVGVAALGQLTLSVDSFVNRFAIDWIDSTIRVGILVAGAAALLGMQYFRRKTLVSRWMLAGVVLLYFLVPPMPFQAAFALNQRLSLAPGAGNPVAMGFVPDKAALADRPVGPSNSRALGNVFVLLPVRATGIPDQSVLLGDASNARLVTSSGEVHELGYQMGFGIWNDQPGEGEKPITYGIRVPSALYQRIADQPLRVEIDYSLTLWRQKESQTLLAAGGDRRTPLLGWCGTKLADDGLEILYGCIQAGSEPTCFSVTLEHPPTGARNRRSGMCRPDYSPYRIGFERDALGHLTMALPFTDPSIPDPLAVRASMLAEATVTARAYQAEDHFVRHMVIPEIRLKEWGME